MKVSDSRDGGPGGVGMLILRDHGFGDKGLPPHSRGCLLGVTINGRFDSPGEYGHWREIPETRAPIGGAQHWVPNGGPIGGFQFAWPVSIDNPTTTPKTSTPSGGGDGDRVPLQTPTGFSSQYAADAATRSAYLQVSSHFNGARPVVLQMGSGEFAKQAAQKLAAQLTGGVAGSGPDIIDVTEDVRRDWRTGKRLTEEQEQDLLRKVYDWRRANNKGADDWPDWYTPDPDDPDSGPDPIDPAQPQEPGKGGVEPDKTMEEKQEPAPEGASYTWKTVTSILEAGLIGQGNNLFVGHLGPNAPGQFPGIAGQGDITKGGDIFVGIVGGNAPKQFPGLIGTGPTKENPGGAIFVGVQGNVGQFGVAGPAGVEGAGGPPAPKPQGMRPIRGEGWSSDTRFKSTWITRAPGHPEYPRGYTGISLVGTDEDRQIEQFHPTDPRLIVPAAPSDHDLEVLGTPIADVNSDGGIDTVRQAPLHYLMRVVGIPQGRGGMLQANRQRARNWIALNIGPSLNVGFGCGIWADLPPDGGKKPIFAMPAASQGGPFDVGSAQDRHRVGSDADGNPINTLHIQTGANYRILGDTVYDGPLRFEQQPTPPMKDTGVPQAVHLQFDMASGDWRWWCRDYWVVPYVPDEPPYDPPPPPVTQEPKPEPKPGTPTLPGGTLISDGPSLIGSGVGSDRRTVGSATWVDTAMPALSFMPQLQVAGAIDHRTWDSPHLDDVAWRNWQTPVTGRLEAYGAQGGSAGGPYLEESDGWVRTHEQRAYAAGGTANGGLVLLPAEVTMTDIDSDFAPAGVALSSAYLVAAPGTCFAAGLPNLATGGVRSGYKFGVNAAGDLVFTPVDSAASDGDAITMEEDGSLTITTPAAPLHITSAVAVTNLNADLLDGEHASAFADASHNHPIGDLTAFPVVGWSTSNSAPSRAVDADGTLAEIGDGLTTLIEDLIVAGLLSA